MAIGVFMPMGARGEAESELIDRAYGTIIGVGTGAVNLAAGFDGITNQPQADSVRFIGSSVTARYGKSYPLPIKVDYVVIFPPNNGNIGAYTNTSFTLYGKNSVPTSNTDGTALSSAIGDPKNGTPITIENTADKSSLFSNVWLSMSDSFGVRIAEMEIYGWG